MSVYNQNTVCPEQRLWLEVLRHGLIEQLTGRRSPSHDATARPETNWTDSRGFRDVCQMAGIEPNFVTSNLHRMDWRELRVNKPMQPEPMLEAAE